jgi:hypothetical protein
MLPIAGLGPIISNLVSASLDATSGIGASFSLPLVPVKARYPNPQRPFDVGSGTGV